MLARNGWDLDCFVEHLGARHAAGSLSGPFALIPTAHVSGAVKLFIGKATRELREATSPA